MADIPMMFRAQIPDRGKIQYAGNYKPAAQWVDEWLKGCPPTPKSLNESEPIWKRQVSQPVVKMPKFGTHVKTADYQICWRLVTNSGQDEGVIRPVIGAKGLPFFPGSSMKGAFWRACPPEERMKYCGGEITQRGEKRTKPGILRFHGGYPINMTWADRDRLVDVVHGQQPYQIMRSNANHTANVQISLYQPKFRFGISSSVIPDKDPEWNHIWHIWEQALAKGIGSRVSAGYGYVDKINQDSSITPLEDGDRILLSVHLKGQGLTSQLLTKDEDNIGIPEFRPNMFKAALRGHTLRLLGGLTNQRDEQGQRNEQGPLIAEVLTNKLWGGIDGGAIVGLVGINFQTTSENLQLKDHYYTPRNREISMSTYDLKQGQLDLLKANEVSPELKIFLSYLVRFTLLLSGFGKSWRRVDHRLFYSAYFDNNDKAMIGCHWEILPASKKLYISTNNLDLGNVTKFLNDTQDKARAWMCSESYEPNGYIENWREAWHPDNVQVWGRLAKNKKDSLAVHWFHGPYLGSQSIKLSELTGWSSRNDRTPKTKIGRIWHRMYPRYVKTKDGRTVRYKDEYVELLTLFPDESTTTEQFLTFLQAQAEPIDSSNFRKLWGGED
ncbi:hypothetical protein PCC9214_05842 [Planktothrix tepida]|uniref:RAMP superfamily protein n=2 Tax=Planktothrix TaxID=54304 RepID=A0A1J1LUB6_9CYAN|nr:hypothetical protein PCC9214_05842 [Planktothrix tepida]CUR35436.1 conserved hypothetical protein [Planktothrix tepida PCC 9214]